MVGATTGEHMLHHSRRRPRRYREVVAKDDEINYLSKLGEGGREHALNKPWSDPGRGTYLLDIGALLSVMPTPPGRLLDIGAGTGWTSCLLALAGYQVTATDIAPEMVELQQANAARYGVALDDTVVCDFESLPSALDGQFEVALFYDCLHHSDDEQAALANAYRALRPGGVCVTLEPGRGHARNPDSVRAREVFGTTERDMPPSRIIAAARAVGFVGHALFERPLAPLPLTRRRWTSPRTTAVMVRRLLIRATPLVLTQGHLVVLQK